MNLISCQYCGVVIDVDRIEEPDIWDDDNEVIDKNCIWIYCVGFESAINCPCCDEKITYSGKGQKKT